MGAPELPESEEFQKPVPPRRAMTVHELRRVVKAREKYLLTVKSPEDAITLLQDSYGCDDDSCLAFIEWLRGGEVSLPPTKGAIERIHIKTDPETGIDHRIETQPGSIPPRPL